MQQKQLPETTQISLNEYQNYSNTFTNCGHILSDIQLHRQLPLIITKFLPNNYHAVDLGSGKPIDGTIVQQLCKNQGKEGLWENVDPFYDKDGVLKMTGEQYMQKGQQKDLDLILSKQSLHFNTDQSSFFKNAYRRMKDSGTFIITQMGNDCQIPWTQPIQKTFVKSCEMANQVIPHQLFTYEIKNQKYFKKLEKDMFKHFIAGRGWSNMLANTQQEIDQCIKQIDSQEVLPDPCISVYCFILKKKL